MTDDYKDFGESAVGTRRRFRATYRDPDTLLHVDPSLVECYVWRDGDAITQQATVARVDTGIYDAFFVPDRAGDYFVEIRSAGTWAMVLRGRFKATPSVMPA